MRFLKNISFDEKGLVIVVESGGHHVKFDFGAPLVWQCVDESATSYDKEEVVVSSNEYQILSKSVYLDFALKEFGWYALLNKQEIKHYRLLTANEVVDVIASENPVVITLEF